MKKRSLLLLTALAGLFALGVAQTSTPTPSAAPVTAPAPAPVDATAAIPKAGSTSFFKLHESFLARGKAGPIGVLFLGDSITEGWNKAPHIWEHYFGQYQPANFGIGGDWTQHVIWRIENGELDGISPKVVVLMLGTNNSGLHTGEEIAAGDKKIVELIRAKLPNTKVLLLAIFPRGPRKQRDGTPEPWEKRMAAITAANAEIAKLDDGNMVRFLDINARFLGNDGTIPNIIMPDQLHPNAAGYQLWAEAIQKPLTELMK
jgi:lysophospholipase L1-like esterase